VRSSHTSELPTELEAHGSDATIRLRRASWPARCYTMRMRLTVRLLSFSIALRDSIPRVVLIAPRDLSRLTFGIALYARATCGSTGSFRKPGLRPGRGERRSPRARKDASRLREMQRDLISLVKVQRSKRLERASCNRAGKWLGARRVQDVIVSRFPSLSSPRPGSRFLPRFHRCRHHHHHSPLARSLARSLLAPLTPAPPADSYLFDVRLLFASPSLLAAMERTAPTASARPRLRRPGSCCSCCT